MEPPAAAKRRGRMDVALIGLMRDCLLRISEAAAVRWQDISCQPDKSGRLLIQRSKTDPAGGNRVGYISKTTMTALEAIWPAGDVLPKTLVFGVSRQQIANRMRAAARAAGLANWRSISGHSARVGMVVDLVGRGYSLAEIAIEGRWKDPSMVIRYGRSQLAGRGVVARYYET